MIIAVALASAGCGATAEPTPASPTPIPTEPCEAEMAEPALALLAGLEGYRFQGILEHEQLLRPITLDNQVYEWVSDASVGSVLVPGRLREELIGGEPGRRFFGYDARITTDGRTWVFDSRAGTWHEVAGGFDQHPANAINVILGDVALPWEAVENVPGPPGEGGCVLTADLDDAQGVAAVSLRLDPVLGRIVAWRFEQDRSPEPGDAFRQSVLIRYEVPSANEFQPPPAFEPLPDS